MAGVKISSLPAVTSALLTDFFPVVQAGVTSKETLQQVLNLFSLSANIIQWNNVTAASSTMSAGNGYVANNAGLVTLTLPASAAFGTEIHVQGFGVGGWSIVQNALQHIQIGAAGSTIGVGGSISSTNRYNSVRLLCTVANTTWCCVGGPQGNLTIV